MQPQLLHRVIDRFGLEDCGELVVLATPAQLAGVFDADLWKAAQPGADERFDAARFGTWINVLIEADAEAAAAKIAGMDPGLIATALAQHVRVFDVAAVGPCIVDGEIIGAERPRHDLNCEISGYLIEARRSDAWDAIVSLLLALDAGHGDGFQRVMRACRRLSNRGFERDGLDDLYTDREQHLLDLALDREERREQQGFVTAAQARAFLQTARELDLAGDSAPPRSPIATAYFRAMHPADASTPASGSRDDRASLTAGEGAVAANVDVDRPSSADDATEEAIESAVAAIADVVLGDITGNGLPRGLLAGAPAANDHAAEPPLARIRELLDAARAADAEVYLERTAELAYLANALVAGCSFQQRAFTLTEASDAAVAICNLGLERWPPRWRAVPRDDVGAVDRRDRCGARESGAAEDRDGSAAERHGGSAAAEPETDLLTAFQIGWAVLYREVCLKTADALIAIVAGLRPADRDLQIGLNGIRIELIRQRRAGAPWRACETLDVLMILDQSAWAALLGLLDECPVLHPLIDRTRRTPVRSFKTSDFVFISTNAHIASADSFIESLPSILRS
jgi:hypothetical protein